MIAACLPLGSGWGVDGTQRWCFAQRCQKTRQQRQNPEIFYHPGSTGTIVCRAHEELVCLTGTSGGEESWEGTREETVQSEKQTILLEKENI